MRQEPKELATIYLESENDVQKCDSGNGEIQSDLKEMGVDLDDELLDEMAVEVEGYCEDHAAEYGKVFKNNQIDMNMDNTLEIDSDEQMKGEDMNDKVINEIDNVLGIEDSEFIEANGIIAINFDTQAVEVVEDPTYSFFDFYNQNSFYDYVSKVSENTDIDELLREINETFVGND